MKPSEITDIIKSLQINPDDISNKKDAEIIRILLQIIERLTEEVQALKTELQKTRDELNTLKGEKGKPKIPASKPKSKDFSSEKERKSQTPPSEKKSKEKLSKIKIDATEVCPVDKSTLPGDAVFKDYDPVVVQEITITTKNTLYMKEVYYSPSQHKTYTGKLPKGVEGEFGHGIKSLITTMKHAANVSEPKIHEFLENIGIHISPATISRILTKNLDIFHQEKADIFRAGLESTMYQQIDDTGAKVKGQNHYVEIICNPFYTAYFTIPHKNRLSILEILQGGKPRTYFFNDEAFALLESFGLSRKQKKLSLSFCFL
jgi:regulator of replication initiation timing